MGILAAQCAQHRGASKVILIDQVRRDCWMWWGDVMLHRDPPRVTFIRPLHLQEQYRLDFADRRLDPHTLVTINGRQEPVAETVRKMLPHGPDVCVEVRVGRWWMVGLGL